MPVKLKKETNSLDIREKFTVTIEEKKTNLCFQEWLPFQWSIYNKTQLCIHKQNEAEDEKKKKKSMTFWTVCELSASLQSSRQSRFSGWLCLCCSGSVWCSAFQIFSWIKGCCRAWLILMRLAGSSISVPSSRSFSCITFFLWSSGSRWPPIMSASRSLVGLMVLITVTFS